jgi:hypothetical protein
VNVFPITPARSAALPDHSRNAPPPPQVSAVRQNVLTHSACGAECELHAAGKAETSCTPEPPPPTPQCPNAQHRSSTAHARARMQRRTPVAGTVRGGVARARKRRVLGCGTSSRRPERRPTRPRLESNAGPECGTTRSRGNRTPRRANIVADRRRSGGYSPMNPTNRVARIADIGVTSSPCFPYHVSPGARPPPNVGSNSPPAAEAGFGSMSPVVGTQMLEPRM